MFFNNFEKTFYQYLFCIVGIEQIEQQDFMPPFSVGAFEYVKTLL